MRRLHELHGLHGPDVRGVRPFEVIGLVWFANLIGSGTLIVDYLFVFPFPERYRTADIQTGNVLLGVGCMLASWIILGFIATPRARRALGWTNRQMAPDAEERRLTLGLPWWLFWMQVLTWLVSCTVFFWVNVDRGVPYALQLSGALIISGLATAATSYLLCLRLFKSATARVLELEPPRSAGAPAVRHSGVAERGVFIWALTTGVPVLGMVLMVGYANQTDVSLDRISTAGLVVGLAALVTGAFGTVLFAKSVGEPLGELTEALAAIEEGDLSVGVTVDDAGEIGRLQTGLNNMVGAIREREQLRDLFGRHVGADVARLALQQGVSLGGEERECAALFVDVIGSTTFAAQRSPSEVVAALNRFFEVVVSVVGEHGGLVNKFEGDAALCIFGAPLELHDPAASALAAARQMSQRLREEVPDLDAGIGVSHGLVIAGNIGSTERLEYTVIGDPVNEAARLTEQAKERPERVVASERIVERAGYGEQRRWQLLEPILLRGRLEETTLAVPL